MGTFSPTHWFVVLLMITPQMALLIVPTWRILQRAGLNRAWALLMLDTTVVRGVDLSENSPRTIAYEERFGLHAKR